MPDTPDTPPPAPPPPAGFPYATAVATLVTLFLFLGLVLVAYYSPNYLGETKTVGPKADPAAKLDEVRARNQAVLDGTDPGVKMSVGKATTELIGHAAKNKDDRNKLGRLPFPTEPAPPAPDMKDKK
jgi:hypothetical protein